MKFRPGSRFGGCHVLAQFSGVDPALADDTTRLRGILSTVLTSAGATVCGMMEKRFTPHGVTVVALLTESHASIHSYPERGAMFVDVFTCGDSADAEHAVRLLCKELAATDAAVQTVFRGSGKEIVEPLGPGLTRNWQLSEVVCDVHTDYQHVVIGRTEQGVALFSDGERQSTEFSQLVYHEALLVPALLLAPRIQRVLIIGSGEGVVSQLAVTAGATHVDHVDIDREAVRLCAEHLPYGYSTTELLRAEDGIGPITVHYLDGCRFVEETTDCYDIVVIDGPDERTDFVQHNRLYGTDFLAQCARIGEVVVGQAGCPTLWRNAGLQRSWQRFHERFHSVVYFGSDEHEWAFLSGLHGPLGDPAATMRSRLHKLAYRPQTIDAEMLAASTIPPRTLRAATQ
jgi:spermidine synthase